LFEEFKKIGSFEIAKNRPEDYNQVSQEWISIINEIIDFWNKYYINQPTNFKKPIKVKDYVFTGMEADDFGDLYINRRRYSNKIDYADLKSLKGLLKGLKELYPEYFEGDKFGFFGESHIIKRFKIFESKINIKNIKSCDCFFQCKGLKKINLKRLDDINEIIDNINKFWIDFIKKRK
jgi:hypothetical protein